jgi:hypothetical protein
MFQKGSPGTCDLHDASISSEERESKFAFVFQDRPAEVGLRDVESSCRPAEVQFARHGQGEYQFLEWGSKTHEFTAKDEMVRT